MPKESSQLRIILHGIHNVLWSDSLLSLFHCLESGSLEDFKSNVLEDGREKNGGSSSNSLSILASLAEGGHSVDGESAV